MLNILAQELNNTLDNCVAGKLLSESGRRIFFPKGIIAQGAEAKAHASYANATIGTTVVNGTPVILPCIQDCAPTFSASELVAYAPTSGNPELRKIWKEKLSIKNPTLKGKFISNPVVVPGLTAGISDMAELFLGSNEPLLVADPSWDNYSLIVETRLNSELHRFKMFNNGKFDIDALEVAMKEEAKSGSVRVLLNFPQNPSGYSPTHEEVQRIVSIVKSLAESGVKILFVSDDAYFGLNYEENIEKQSLFAYMCDLHENVLALKIDGPTKEDFVWGFRCGFITFGWKGATEDQYAAIEKKLAGVIRSTVSCCSTPAQSMVLRAFKDPEIENQKEHFRKVLEGRYKKVRSFVDSHTSKSIEPLPFNSGYFMSLNLIGIDAETLRTELLNKKGIGTIAIDSKTLRVAFSSLDEDKIETVYSAIYEVADSLAK